MQEKDIHGCIEGLASYAAERQAGYEQHQLDRAPFYHAQRTQRLRTLIGGMAAFYQISGNVEVDFIKPFDERLAEAGRSSAVELTPLQLQQEAVTGLWSYAQDLCRQENDPRETLLQVRAQFIDMAGHLDWNPWDIGLSRAKDWVGHELPHITALQPIRFTRLLLGPETGPVASDFLPGAVKDADAVMETELYQEFCHRYPEKQEWPAICVVYQGGRDSFLLHDATELDLGIIRESGDRFLDQKGVSWIGGPYELEILTGPVLSM